MPSTFFNFRNNIAESNWDRRSFLSKWWRIYSRDPNWVPPFYPALRRAIEPDQNPHLARMDPVLAYTEAARRPRESKPSKSSFDIRSELVEGISFEIPVATAILGCDPRSHDRSAYFALLHVNNESESLERWLDFATEEIMQIGCRRLVGPTGISPLLDSGVLMDHWDKLAPIYTPYNPPYLSEMIRLRMDEGLRSRLYYLQVPEEQKAPPPGKVTFKPFDPQRLTNDLLSLFQETSPYFPNFPQPDEEEARYLLRRTEPWPMDAWLSEIEGEPAGFVVLQPDQAERLKRANGGKNLFRRLWLTIVKNLPTENGRIVFGGVLPKWRRKGVGSLLLYQALHQAVEHGWKQISIGPILEDSSGSEFLKELGAVPQQTYQLFSREL